MNKLFIFIIVSLSFHLVSFADSPIDITERSMVDTSLVPFYHGVASGDPTPNSVILWTRVTPETNDNVNGTWRVALDTNFTSIVQSGTFLADSTKDYCVKIDVNGLQPNTWYFYEFTALGRNSLIGRTKTAPVSGTNQLRFAFVSCANYPNGYFNVYNRIRERNDIDAVLHLGDYIYEYAGIPATRNGQQPLHEIIKLADYRQRYSSYRLDPALMKLHQQFPFITVWDDHETANNSYSDGADNHTPGVEGLWSARKSAGQQANDEWLPTRLPEVSNPNRIWRKLSFGNMADIFMLDTRLYDRSLQGGNTNDSSRHIIGNEQMQWLKTELINSTAKWKIIGQQVMMGNLTPFGIMLNNDQWDGYSVERKKLYDIILNNNLKNVIVLTGDIHTAWAMDLPYNTSTYNPSTGAGSVGVEFVCTSVTSSSSPIPLDPIYNLVTSLLPHIKYVDLHKKGYGILDLQNNAAQGDFYSVPTITQLNPNQAYETGYFTLDNTRWLKKASSKTIKTDALHYFAPENPRDELTTAIKNKSTNLILLSAYPNPFIDRVTIQFNVATSEKIEVNLVDLSGKILKQEFFGHLTKGLYNKTIHLDGLASGAYNLVVRSNNEIIERTIVKF
ncbi:MAG TPA: alkaline phosphatase D family protein [Chitinophagales bacterium]|jgi:alkaline phosphatase D|nr:alkaline phosphatase D family protein [Chitinophagales bacterium]HQV77387.1 alkaline phosphatase D family protein [Chitinophagales bacterium]HQW78449.1 alkaline phosphatase D family protein [Chitinophagales bacterium]